MTDKVHCLISTMLATAQMDGSNVDPALIAHYDDHAKGAFAATTNRFEQRVQALAEANAPIEQRTGSWMSRNFKVGENTLLGIKDPSVILGEGIVKPIDDALTAHYATHKTANADAFKTEIQPLVDRMRQQLETGAKLGQIEPSIQGYANNYLRWVENGAGLYDLGHNGQVTNYIAQAAGKMAQNAVGAIVRGNPMISLANTFEFMPKALYYAIEQGGPAAGPMAVLKGIATFGSKTGLKLSAQIPELQELGVYNLRDHHPTPQGLFGKAMSAILDVTENPLRGLSYYVGEAVKPGGGREALQRIAYVYRPGRVPSMLWTSEANAVIPLMRYSIETLKFYGQMAKNLTGPNKGNAAAALVAFAAMQAVQTGVQTNIPAPIYAALPQEWKDNMAQINDQVPLFNLAGKLTRKDFAAKTQAGGLSFGIGFDVVNRDFKQGYKALTKDLPEAIAAGDLIQAGFAMGEGYFTAGQALGAPGATNSMKRILDVAKERAMNQIDDSQVLDKAVEKFGLQPAK